jgi:hypothetical protein
MYGSITVGSISMYGICPGTLKSYSKRRIRIGCDECEEDTECNYCNANSKC